MNLGLPMGVMFFRTIELIYRPMLSVPLGSESSPVFGGQRQLATRLAVLPFELSLRYASCRRPREQHLERVLFGGVSEGVVRLHDVRQGEAVTHQLFGVQTPSLHDSEQLFEGLDQSL